jgi:predicted AlkP superfamily phosphohydrolase/phosphomutase
MSPQVVAIGLDSADPELLAEWIAAGKLPHLAQLQKEGVTGTLENFAELQGEKFPYSSTEGNWVAFQTGVSPQKTGYWETFEYDPLNYTATSDQTFGGYKYDKFPPFFALRDQKRVTTFDIPVTRVFPEVNGKQIVGWGGHFPFVERGSSPTNLLENINQQYGKNEILYHDYGVFWNRKYLDWLESSSIISTKKRTKITLDLMDQEQSDLFIGVYGEPHGASHDLWFASRPDHPLHSLWNRDDDPLLNVFQEIDRGIGELRKSLAPNTNFCCFSVHGIQNNVTDLGSFFFLPELMYRMQFPGKSAFANTDPNSEIPLPITEPRHNHWFGEIWRKRTLNSRFTKALQKYLPAWLIIRGGNRELLFPYFLDWFGPEAGWMPAVWYRPCWPKMRSFCIPSFSDGHIRVNVKGRERDGMVPPDQYQQEIDRVRQFLEVATNPRTGQPIIKQMVQTRKDPFEQDKAPEADLLIIWNDEAFDVVDHPQAGRIGPVPYHRTGGHHNKGYFSWVGPQFPAGEKVEGASILDLAPTILELMDVSRPDHLEGQSLLEKMSLEKAF